MYLQVCSIVAPVTQFDWLFLLLEVMCSIDPTPFASLSSVSSFESYRMSDALFDPLQSP